MYIPPWHTMSPLQADGIMQVLPLHCTGHCTACHPSRSPRESLASGTTLYSVDLSQFHVMAMACSLSFFNLFQLFHYEWCSIDNLPSKYFGGFATCEACLVELAAMSLNLKKKTYSAFASRWQYGT